MASRDLSNFRSVVSQVTENKDSLLNLGASITESIVRQGQEAKINESASQVSLELTALQNQYQIDFEGDPMGGLEKYKADRQKIFDGYGKGISPLYGRQWQETTRNMAARNDAMQQGWALKQTRVNTVNSINTSMKNNFSQASADGMTFGQRDDADIESFINFAASKTELEKFGDRNLGEETTSSILETYDEDYMKSFLSGVSEVNPLKALSLMDKDAVKNGFSNPAEYSEIKGNIENRALNFQKIAIQKEALGALKANDDIINRSIDKPFSQAEILQLSNNVSKPTKDYLMTLGGFKTGGSTLSDFEKAKSKAKLQERVLDYGVNPDIGASSLQGIQDDLITALNDKVITKDDWQFYTNQLMQPYAAQVEENLSQFQFDKSNFFGLAEDTKIGFSQVKSDLQPLLIGYDSETGEVSEDKISEDDFFYNNQQRIKMYSQYERSLRRVAEKNGITPDGILKLPSSDRDILLQQAAGDAKKNYFMDKFPSTRAMADNFPARIIDQNGEAVKTGLASGKPEASVSVDTIYSDAPSFSSVAEMDAAGLPSGTAVIVNGVRGNVQ